MEFFEKSAVEFQNEELASGGVLQHALARARRYLVAEAALLEAIAEVDRLRIYEAFHYTHLTPYCVRELGLSEDVAACFVRVARKGREVPELQAAVAEENPKAGKPERAK